MLSIIGKSRKISLFSTECSVIRDLLRILLIKSDDDYFLLTDSIEHRVLIDNIHAVGLEMGYEDYLKSVHYVNLEVEEGKLKIKDILLINYLRGILK